MKRPNVRQDGPSRKRFKGFTLPNKNYMGPLNPLDNGPLLNEGDAISLLHDVDGYEELANNRPFYRRYTKADQRFLERMRKIHADPSDLIGRTYYEAKRKLATYDHANIQAIPYAAAYKKSRLGISEQDFDRLLAERSNGNTEKPKEEISPDLPTNKRKVQHSPNFPRLRKRLFFTKEGQQELQSNETMSGADGADKGSGNAPGLKETPIDDVWNVQRGPPDYQFATLPWIIDTRWDASVTTRSFDVRMTSPYNVWLPQTNTDHNVGAGETEVTAPTEKDSGDTSLQSANWWHYYQGLYKYYHVVAARWHATIENYANAPMWVHQLYYNDDLPNLLADNTLIMTWPDTYSHYVGQQAAAIGASGSVLHNETAVNSDNVSDATAGVGTANYNPGNHVTGRGPPHILQLSGTYHPGDYTREIKLDADIENWTLTNRNPKLPERLHLRFNHTSNNRELSSASNSDRFMSFRLFFRIEYLVEFKELRQNLKYPVARQPLTVTIAAPAVRENTGTAPLPDDAEMDEEETENP